MTGYWDIHNHILPGVDDGSGCMRETMEMLEEEYRQGVRHIVFTPHYRRDMFARRNTDGLCARLRNGSRPISGDGILSGM